MDITELLKILIFISITFKFTLIISVNFFEKKGKKKKKSKKGKKKSKKK